MATPNEILKQYWGYDKFRPMQLDIIQSVLGGKDTLALLPTGGGKSVCFQVPGLVMEGICIVVSPLIALMKDQVDNLVKRGINAVTINSTMSYSEIDIALDNCIYGNTKFLYLSPERLGTDIVRERIKKMKVNLLAVDEAHCISQWGHDFRPSYLKIAEVRELIPKVPVMALTASATPETVEDIQKQLHFKQPNVLSKSFARSNVAYVVRYDNNTLGKLLEICQGVKGTGIVYVRNRKATKDIAAFLSRNKVSANFYHAGLTIAERTTRQTDWLQGKVRVIVCTNAFGMGIDKPDVRFVVHTDLPDSPEAYFQEAGRAGRDGEKAYAVLISHEGDATQAEQRFETSFPPPEEIKRVYKALGNYYRIAEGAGEGQTYEFDLQHFCNFYKMEPLPVYSSLKLLEKEGYLELTEAIFQPSRLYIPHTHAVLYNYQIQNPTMDTFIKTLLRVYGGLFENYVNIRERDIARHAKLTLEQVTQRLDLLKKQQVIDYIPSTDKPQIIMLQPLFGEKQLRLSYEMYGRLKMAYEKRMRAMLHYAAERDECRSVLLLQYFGEHKTQPCGMCDYCTANKKVDKTSKRDIAQRILHLAVEKPLRADNLLELMNDFDTEMVKQVLKVLLDDGLLLIMPDGTISTKA